MRAGAFLAITASVNSTYRNSATSRTSFWKMALSTTNTIPLEQQRKERWIILTLVITVVTVVKGTLQQVVWVSPGGRFELLQVLVAEAVVSWQIYQSPGVALNTQEGTLKHAHAEGGLEHRR